VVVTAALGQVIVTGPVQPPVDPASSPPSDRGVATSIPVPWTRHYDRKRAEGKNTKEGLRALKRQISDVLYRTMIADAKRVKVGPGGHTGTTKSPA
jgi:hypothetical protein